MDWFCDYVQGHFGHVTIATGKKCKIEVNEIIKLNLQNGRLQIKDKNFEDSILENITKIQ